MSESICKSCSRDFEVTDEDRVFYAKITPQFGEHKVPIPEPTLCPLCRLQRRAVWRNEYIYYIRNCDICDRRIVSVHDPNNSYPVYCNQCWWGDEWEPLDFGQEIDFSEPFFPQFKALQARVPKPAMANDNHLASVNIEYCQGVAYSKNCYLVTTAWRLEDSLYSANCGESTELVDCRFVGNNTELAYECTTCTQIYSSSFLDQSESCRNCHFGIDLKGCSDCIGCFGLRHKRYHHFQPALQ